MHDRSSRIPDLGAGKLLGGSGLHWVGLSQGMWVPGARVDLKPLGLIKSQPVASLREEDSGRRRRKAQMEIRNRTTHPAPSCRPCPHYTWDTATQRGMCILAFLLGTDHALPSPGPHLSAS